MQHIPKELLTNISSPWPFSTWGIDIVGTLPLRKRQVKFLLVAIDYFTKWVEVEPLAVIIGEKIQSFIIFCRFGIPRTIISVHGQQFDSWKFEEFYAELGIQNHYSSPGHPQANGKIEVKNRTLLKLIKARLEGAKGAWPEELPSVLWAYKTTT